MAEPGQTGPLIRLPTPADRPAAPLDPTAVFGPDRPGEVPNKVPGAVADDERVRATVAPDGQLRSVVVDQRLTLSGVGDFHLSIPGPATDVQGPPDAPNRPGLLRGALLWEGFSAGTKVLDATVTLNPDLEQFKVPFTVSTSGGVVRITNRTAVALPVSDGDPAPAPLHDALANAVAALASGTPPVAGTTLPAALPARGEVTTASVDVAAPFRVTGEVRPPNGPPVPFDATVPGPQAPDGVLTVPASGPVSFTATPSMPDATGLRAAQPDRSGLRALEIALWQSLRLDDVSSYLGVPLPHTAKATYTYETAAPPPIPAVSPRERPKPFAIALAVAALLAIVAISTAIWAKN